MQDSRYSGRRTTSTRSSRAYYIEGNTVRQTQPNERRRSTSADQRRRSAQYGASRRSNSVYDRRRTVNASNRSSSSYAAGRRSGSVYNRSYSDVRNRAAAASGSGRAQTQSRGYLSHKERMNRKIAMGNRKKAERMNFGYTLFLCIALFAALASCVIYLNAQSTVTQKNEAVISLKSELNLLTETNSQTKERINDSIDLEYVRKYATDVLGMVYPAESQIIKYHSDDEDYIKQYQDIPQTGE